ncbi:MAG: hypothetical protein JXA99_07125 [Candidatus Lokiarchaeota archaeon]|nr:hypothetical protein [Candidatus Lokiarchaeota archaeon]
MKKSKIISIFILTSFLILGIIPNYTIAQSSGYCGVSVGDKRSYTVTIHSTGLLNLISDLSEIIPDLPEGYEDIFAAGDQAFGFNLEVISVSPENYTTIGSIGYHVVGLNATMEYMGMPLESEEIETVVFDPEERNYFNNTFLIEPKPIPPGIIMPVGANWTDIVEDINSLISIPGPEDPITLPPFTISALANGITINIPACSIAYNSSVTLNLAAFDISMTYADDGWMQKISVNYGGNKVITMEEGAIPGYELVVFIGVSAISLLGIILYVRKRATKIRI